MVEFHKESTLVLVFLFGSENPCFNPENALENLFRAYPPRRTNQRLRRLFFCIRSAAKNLESKCAAEGVFFAL